MSYDPVVYKKWYQKNRKKKIRQVCDYYSKESKKELRRKNEKKRNARVRIEVYKHYGNECACCGENEPLFLSIDHINNDGADHRRELTEGWGGNIEARRRYAGVIFYHWIKRNRFPSNLQLLCMNCNMGKQRNNGICPHEN